MAVIVLWFTEALPLAVTALLGAVRTVGSGPLHVSCDKQGGRNAYAAMLQAAVSAAGSLLKALSGK